MVSSPALPLCLAASHLLALECGPDESTISIPATIPKIAAKPIVTKHSAIKGQVTNDGELISGEFAFHFIEQASKRNKQGKYNKKKDIHSPLPLVLPPLDI
ncbi:hypothetical protein BDZ91DRAFT_536489 [Kalaharituber pfeilii]|nr:hypothetical protein BDZ91DRAFT_536489 [Kalaharituber pfeilii]